jgi:hypothetical protein
MQNLIFTPYQLTRSETLFTGPCMIITSISWKYKLHFKIVPSTTRFPQQAHHVHNKETEQILKSLHARLISQTQTWLDVNAPCGGKGSINEQQQVGILVAVAVVHLEEQSQLPCLSWKAPASAPGGRRPYELHCQAWGIPCLISCSPHQKNQQKDGACRRVDVQHEKAKLISIYSVPTDS